jgi:hypothetical protein
VKDRLVFFSDSEVRSEEVPDPLMSGIAPSGRKYDLDRLDQELEIISRCRRAAAPEQPSSRSNYVLYLIFLFSFLLSAYLGGRFF